MHVKFVSEVLPTLDPVAVRSCDYVSVLYLLFYLCQCGGILMKDLIKVLYFMGRSLLWRYRGWVARDLTGSRR